MGRKHPNPQAIKIHRSYTVEEAAEVLGIHKNTFRKWLRDGLTPMDRQRPILIHGHALRDFLRGRRAKSKSPCPPGHLYCFRCRAPTRPAANMADYVPINTKVGKLVAICDRCEGWIHRLVSAARFEDFRGNLGSTLAPAPAHIGGSDSPNVKCDSGKKDGTYATD